MDLPDYSDHVEVPEDRSELTALIDQLSDAEAEVTRKELELKMAQKRVQEIAEQELPAAMEKFGFQEFLMSDGRKVELEEQTFANISEARRAAAHAWLESHDEGGMIKREVGVAFNKDQEKEARDLLAELAKKYPGVKIKAAVHGGTLKAWVKKQLKNGRDIPLDLFAVHTKTIAKVK